MDTSPYVGQNLLYVSGNCTLFANVVSHYIYSIGERDSRLMQKKQTDNLVLKTSCGNQAAYMFITSRLL